MKKKTISKSKSRERGGMLPHYDFDYRKAKPNRFAARVKPADLLIVAVEPDVAEVFPTAEAVNDALRALVRAMRTTVQSSAK